MHVAEYHLVCPFLSRRLPRGLPLPGQIFLVLAKSYLRLR